MADYRPLLAHNVKHARLKQHHSHMRASGGSAAPASEAVLEHLVNMDMLLAEEQRSLDAEMEQEFEAIDESRSLACTILQSPLQAQRPKWDKALSNVSQASFERALDTLSSSSAAAAAAQHQHQHQLNAPHLEPRSAAVVHEAHRLSLEQRIAAHKAVLLNKARSRGEETDVIEALGFEANVVVLGEPNGPSKAWGAGVATLLSEHTRPLEPPPAPSPVQLDDLLSASSSKADEQLEALSAKLTQTFIAHTRPARARELETLDTAEPNLFLSHALVQTQLPRLLAWDRIEAQMDAAVWSSTAAAQEDGQGGLDRVRALEHMRKGVNVALLNATPLPSTDVEMDSVRRKRKKKMRKQKYRKLRKATRTERRRQKRD